MHAVVEAASKEVLVVLPHGRVPFVLHMNAHGGEDVGAFGSPLAEREVDGSMGITVPLWIAPGAA